MLEVGVATANIDPPPSLPHAGWGAQTHVVPDGVDSHLLVTALFASDGRKTAAMLEYDVCVFSPEQVALVRETAAQALGLANDAVRVVTTHNHAGPMIEAGYYEGSEAVRSGYIQLLAQQGASAALWARAARQPAVIAAGHGSCDFAVNRRQRLESGRVVTGCDFEGFTDPEVKVARIDKLDGGALAVLFGYACHATTLGPANRRISADYPGSAKELVLALTDAVPLFLQGAAGNVGPGPEGFTDDVSVPRRLGRILACETVKVYEGIRTRPVRFVFDRVMESGAPLGLFRAEPESPPDQTIDFLSVPVTMPVRPQPPLAEAEERSRALAEALRQLHASGASKEELADATFRAKRASMVARRARSFAGGATKDIELHLLRLGPVVLAGIPGEPFAEIGVAIKAASPFPDTFFGGYTNGTFGYIPMADAYPLGGYEVDTTPFGPEAAQTVTDATLKALAELKKRQLAASV